VTLREEGGWGMDIFWIQTLFPIRSQCTVSENIHTHPKEGIGISWGVGGGGVMRPKHLKKCMKLNWNFQRGEEALEKIPSVGEVWIFSGTTQFIDFIH